jgi:hypothetical protein
MREIEFAAKLGYLGAVFVAHEDEIKVVGLSVTSKEGPKFTLDMPEYVEHNVLSLTHEGLDGDGFCAILQIIRSSEGPWNLLVGLQ